MNIKKRKILIRFDDICPTMNWEQWGKAKQLLDEAGVKALLGVVPECEDPDLKIDEIRKDFWVYIKELQSQGYTIAMHGLTHVFELKADGLITRNKISEFAGLPYEKQLAKIRRGKEILNNHGIGTDVFFAPAHSYDDNTLKALSQCGFRYVSDGFSRKPYKRYGVTLLPCRTGGIPKIKKGFNTAIVHAHEWVKPNKVFAWRQYQKLLSNNAKDIVSFEEFCQWPCSNRVLQRMNEFLYLMYRQVVMKVGKLLR